MNVIGTGVDIVDMRRIEKMLSKYGERFLKKILTEKEKEMVYNKTNPRRILESVASLFSMKESVFKAIGGKKIAFNEIEIVKRKDGLDVNLYGKTKKISEKKNIDRILMSVSHDAHLCITFAIAVSKQSNI